MKKKTFFRRLTAFVLALSLILSLAACGSKSDTSGQGANGQSSGNEGGKNSSNVPAATMPEITVKDGVVRSTKIEIKDGENYTDGLTILGVDKEWIYGYFYNYEGESDSNYQLIRFKKDGTGLAAKPLPMGNDDEIAAAAFGNGCYYLVIVTYHNSEALDYELANQGATNLEIPDGLSEDATSSYQLICLSAEGEVKWKADINQPKESDSFYIQSMQSAEDGFMLVTSEGVDKYDQKDGKFLENICSIKAEEQTGTLYLLSSGQVIMVDDSGTNTRIASFDKNSGKFRDEMSLPNSLQGAVLYPGKQYDFYLVGDTGIFGAKLGSTELKAVLNYVNSDLDIQGVNTMIESDEGTFLVQAYGSGSSLENWFLEPVDPKDVVEKKQITLGGYYIDFEVRSEVIKFNKESNDYRITMTDYSEYDLESDDYSTPTGMTKMNTDIVSGNAPDILFMSDSMPVNKYISSGIFQDLTDRYESDPDIPRDDFFQNILNAFKTDGKTFVMVPGFYITGIAGKEKYIGDGSGLTIKKAKEISEKMGIKTSEIFGLATRDQIFESAIEFSGDKFINEKDNTCDFNNDQFREILDFVKEFPTEISEDRYNDYFKQYLGDRALLGIQYINTVYDYEYMTRQLYGDLKMTITGFPSSQDKGAAVAAPIQIGISSSASDPDGCWSFVRRFLLPEYQEKMESCLPVSEKALYAQGQTIINNLKEQREAERALLSEAVGGQEIAILDAQGEDKTEDKASESSTAGVTGSETASESLTGEEASVESEDLTGKPVAREDFDGTDEEYQKYLDEFDSDAGSTGEEMIIAGEEINQEDIGDLNTSDLPDFNEDDIKALIKLVENLTFSVNGETEVLKIIIEEADAFFAGQKSAEEVSDVIQSRVQVYLKEKE